MESNGDCYLSLWPILSYSPIGLGVGVRGGGGGIAWGGGRSLEKGTNGGLTATEL